MVLSSEASTTHIYVIDDVINKSRSELVYNGELEESVLSQIESIWKTKMIQAGLISGMIETSSSALIPTPVTLQRTLQTQDPMNPSIEPVMSTKRERDGDGSYIPQQDGARDEITEPYTFSLNDENDEILNEDDDDDDDEEDAIDDDMDIPHLVMCQFDKVKRKKNKWECSLKAGVMQINGKIILFSKATGDFNF